MTPSNGGAQAPGAVAPRLPRHPAARRGRGNLSGDVQKRTTTRPAPRPTPRRRGSGRTGAGPLAALSDPSTPLTGRGLLAAAKALTRLEVAPQANGLRQQIRDTNQQGAAVQQRVGDYYRQFGLLAGAAVGDQQAASDRTNAALKAITDQAQGAIATAGDDATARTQAMADRGLDGGAFARLAAETAAQRQLASQYGQASRTSGALQGGNYEGLTATAKTIGAQRGQESLGQVANAFARQNETPLAKLADLRGQRGALLTKNVGALRQAERDYQLAAGTLGLNQQKAAADVANDRANRRLRASEFDMNRAMKDRQFRLDVQKVGLTDARDRYQREHGLGPYKPATGARAKKLTPTQVNEAFGQIDQARSTIANIRQQAPSMTTQQIRQALTNGYYLGNVDGRTTRLSVPKIKGGGYGAYVNSAMDLALNGYLSPANITALHRAGLLIHGRYKTTAPKTVPPMQGLGLTGRSPFGG